MNEISNIKAIEPPQTLKEMAYESLRKAILSQELRQGPLYSEAGVAKQLDISRSPVREALLELASRGLVRFFPRKGFRVVELNEQDIINLYAHRLIIEVGVIHQIGPIITKPDLDSIGKICAIKPTDKETFYDLNRQFHSSLVHLTKNPYIISALENIWDLSDLAGVQMIMELKNYDHLIEEHKSVFSELKRGDIPAATNKMKNHILNLQNRIIQIIRKNNAE